MPRNRERLNRAMKPLMTLCWVALLAACTPPAGDAASAQPALVSATVAGASAAQTLVCKDPTLTGLDADMGKAVTAAQATLDAAGQSKLHAEQQRWQEHTR
ncbi:hypothetical protein J0L37_19680, partial [Stenotrophomonas maltophilia]|nr:hypothetical protein [Stenotrophomonas maltophilia]